MNRQPEHLTLARLELWIDDDLNPADTQAAQEHLAACTACQREESMLLAVRAELDRLTAPEPPAFFDARILAAVLTPPSEALRWIRAGVRLYGAAAAALVVGILSVALIAGPESFNRMLAGGITKGIGVSLDAVTSTWLGFVNLIKTSGDLIPAAGSLASVFRGLDTAATAMAPHVILSLMLTMFLAVLVLVWASSEPRRKGVPHVHLVL